MNHCLFLDFELVQAVIAVWEEMEQFLINKLMSPMNKRLQPVIDANGWYIKY
jgi:hypothetical protein